MSMLIIADKTALDHYTERAATMTTAALHYALRDVHATMTLRRDLPLSDPYMQKLLAEFDAVSVERYHR